MNLTENFNLVWPTLRALGAGEANDDGTAKLEKVLAMVVLGIGSFASGMLPAFLSERNRQRFPLSTSLLLCFGAGILLATSLVHILPEVRKQMNSNWAEIALCGGFFAIYFIDEFIHYFFGEAIQHNHQSHTEERAGTTAASLRNTYGSIGNNESAPLLSDNHSNQSDLHNGEAVSHQQNHGHSHIAANNCNDAIVENANARICHTSHVEPCSDSMTGTLGLFAALSLHSAIEGLAIGVQNSKTKVLFLLGAVACHKFVMGFCLGLQFRTHPGTSLKSLTIAISVFALGAVGGIGLGMLLVDVPSSWSATSLPVIQGLAGGTLLYVTVCEIMPREKAKWHGNTTLKSAGLLQFVVVAIGFITMAVINYFLDDDA